MLSLIGAASLPSLNRVLTLHIYSSYMCLAFIRYFTTCLDRSSRINQRFIQPADGKMVVGIIIITVIPSVLWTSAMFIFGPVTGNMLHFRISNDTKQVDVLQDVPEEAREQNGAVIALNVVAALQLTTMFLLYVRILAKAYMSTLNVARKLPGAETRRTGGKINRYCHCFIK